MLKFGLLIFLNFINLINLSSAGKRTAEFLLAGACVNSSRALRLDGNAADLTDEPAHCPDGSSHLQILRRLFEHFMIYAHFVHSTYCMTPLDFLIPSLKICALFCSNFKHNADALSCRKRSKHNRQQEGQFYFDPAYVAGPLPGNNPGQVVHTHVPLSPSSIICTGLTTGKVTAVYGRGVAYHPYN